MHSTNAKVNKVLFLRSTLCVTGTHVHIFVSASAGILMKRMTIARPSHYRVTGQDSMSPKDDSTSTNSSPSTASKATRSSLKGHRNPQAAPMKRCNGKRIVASFLAENPSPAVTSRLNRESPAQTNFAPMESRLPFRPTH